MGLVHVGGSVRDLLTLNQQAPMPLTLVAGAGFVPDSEHSPFTVARWANTQASYGTKKMQYAGP